MPRSHTPSVFVALSCVVVAQVDAQQRVIEPGQRIRVTAFDSSIVRMTGVYSGVHDGIFEFVPERSNTVRRVTMNSVTRIESFAGRRSNALNGAVAGFLPFALVGAVLYAADPGDESYTGGAALWYGIVSGAVGAIIGSVIGSLIKTDRWEEVPRETLRVSFVAQPAAVGIRIAF